MRNESEWCQITYNSFKSEYKNIHFFLICYKRLLTKNIMEHYENLAFQIEKTSHCIDKIFEVWPPEQSLVMIDKKEYKKILEATIAFEAFMLNTNAIFDSIAHFWNKLKLESKYKGQTVGIILNGNKKRKEFFDQLPKKFKIFLKRPEINAFIGFAKNIRDSLVHKLSPKIIDMDTSFVAKKNKDVSEKIIIMIIQEFRAGYYKELAESKVSKKILLEKYSDYFRVKPIFELKNIFEYKKRMRYQNCFGHEYVHSFMLELQQLIILLSVTFLTECVEHLNVSEEEKKWIQFLKDEINIFLISPNQ